MKNKLLQFAIALILLAIPTANFGQTPPTMGSTANFVLFSTNGPLANTGTSQITGNVGTNNGAVSTFNNVNGVIHIMNAASALGAADLLTLYNQLNLTTATLIALPTLGNGQVITAGAYSITTASTLNGTLTLNGQGNANAVFIFQLQGAFASNAGAVVLLTNGAQACNVFWKVEGSITLGAGTLMKGNLIANNALISIGAGTVLEGRAMSTTGAVSINGTTAFMPLGCGGATLTGPASPTLGTSACFALFSSNGAVTNTGNTFVTGDVGTNVGLTTGYLPGNVIGTIHGIPDGPTGIAAGELTTAYTYLNGLAYDIQLMNPALFGNKQVLTPHVYFLNGATTLSDSLYLNAQGNVNAIFVIQINGALASAANAKVILQNGAQSKNVFWKIEGAVSLGANTVFKGTIIVNNAAIALNTGVVLDGRALTTAGALDTYSMNVVIPAGCSNPSPTITTQPGSQTVCTGASVSFGVIASGAGLTYQWRNGLVNLVNGGNISGATTATLTINPAGPADVSANYNVLVNGTYLPGVISVSASLVLATAPAITAIAGNQTVCAGSAAIFSTTASGTGLTYQWRNGLVNLSNGGSITGATSAILNINPVALANVSSSYNVVITGLCAPSVTSTNLSLAVNSVPVITTQPFSQTVCAGSPVTFSVGATATGITYQWRNGAVNLTNAGTITGATSAILNISSVVPSDAGSNYNVVITGACSPTVTSIAVVLGVSTSPTITTQAISQTVCVGSPVIFSVVSSGTGLTYQWRKGAVNMANGGNISGATSAILTINPSTVGDAGTLYNVVVTGVCSPTATSANASLLINTSPTITAQAISQTVCAGSSVSFSTVASGTGLTYQWRNGSVNLTNTGNVSGANTGTLILSSVTALDAGSNYNLVVTGVCTPTATSIGVSLVVNISPTITTQALSQTICAGSPVNFAVISVGTGLTYQWRKGAINLTNAGNISGATSSVLSINPVNTSDAGTNYNVVITGVCSPTETSLNASLVVTTSPTITSAGYNQTVCAGSPVIFTVAALGSGLVYQWRLGTVNLSNAGNISGATTATLILNPVTTGDAATNYNVVISGACSPVATSANFGVVVNTSPTITAQANSATLCAGNPVSFMINAVGTGLTYQWRKGTVNLVNSGTISGATSSVLTINPVNTSDAANNYNVVIAGTCAPSVTSANVTLVVNSAPSVITPPVNMSACVGSPVSFSVTATGTGLTYQWRRGTVNLVNGGTISGATTSVLTISSVALSDAANDYMVVIVGTCSANMFSTLVSLTVDTAPVITRQPNNQMVYIGGTAFYFVTATGSGLTYQWYRGNTTLVNAGNISGATSPTLVVKNASMADSSSLYHVIIKGTCGPKVTSENAILWVIDCLRTGLKTVEATNAAAKAVLYPNPFENSINIQISDASNSSSYELTIFNILGMEVMKSTITKQLTTYVTDTLPAGTYVYKVVGTDASVQTGTLILQR